jgi:hypothetical protein
LFGILVVFLVVFLVIFSSRGNLGRRSFLSLLDIFGSRATLGRSRLFGILVVFLVVFSSRGNLGRSRLFARDWGSIHAPPRRPARGQ